MKAATTTRVSGAFPSFTQLLSESWQSLSGKLLSLVVLTFGAGLLNVLLAIVGIVGTVVLAGLQIDWSVFRSDTPDPAKLAQLMEQVGHSLPTLLGGLLLVSVVTGFIGLLVQIVCIKYLGEQKPSSMGDLFKRSVPLVIPFVLMSMLVSLLVFGNTMLLFVPGILAMIVLGFAAYEFILQNAGIVTSLKRSVKIVGSHMGTIVGNVLLLILAYAFLVIFIPNMLIKIEPQTAMLVAMVRLVASIFISWFEIAFVIKLYEHARKRTNLKEEASLTLIIVGAVIGYVLMALVGAVVIKAVKALNLPEKIKEEMSGKQMIGDDLQMAPSSCGIALPIPQSTDVMGGETRKWIYEEVAMTADAFPIIDVDLLPHKFTLASILGYRSEPFDRNAPSFNIDFPAVQVKCTDNPKHYTLDEFITLAKANKTYDITVVEKNKLGDIDVAVVDTSAQTGGKTLSERGMIAVSKDGNRLIYITVWGSDDDDPAKEQIKKDRDTILNALTYREVSGELELPGKSTKK